MQFEERVYYISEDQLVHLFEIVSDSLDQINLPRRLSSYSFRRSFAVLPRKDLLITEDGNYQLNRTRSSSNCSDFRVVFSSD